MRASPVAARAPEVARVHGRNAVLAVWRARPDAVRRVWVHERAIETHARLLRELAGAARPYTVVGDDALARLAESTHHEGIVADVTPRTAVSLDAVLRREGALFLVVLAGIENPHNLGAALRVCAHFGADAVVVEASAPRLGGAVLRTAEGAAEAVDVVRTHDVIAALGAMRRADVRVLGTASEAHASIFDERLPDRVAFVLGAEATGLADAARAACDRVVHVPGTGHIESLNVVSALSACATETWRQRSLRELPRDPASDESPQNARKRVL